MTMQATLRAVTVLLPIVCASAPGAARAADAEPLKAEIEGFLNRLQGSTGGTVHWEGADKFDVETQGDTATATLTEMRFSFRKAPDEPKPLASITFDRVEIRRKPAADGGKLSEFDITLPALTSIVGASGVELAVSLKDAHATALVENPGERQRAATMTVAGGRIDHKNGTSWASFGPLSSSWKLVRNDDGGWRLPMDAELKSFEFLIAETQVAGTVERIGYNAEAAGPNLAALDEVREQIAEIRESSQGNPDKKVEGWLALLPKAVSAFSYSKGELTVEKVNVKRPGGDTLVTLAKATMGGGLTGLDGDKTALRVTIGHEGLAIAPALVPEPEVPQRAVIDLGLEDVATSVLHTLVDAASHSAPGASDADKQKAMQQAMGAAMSLNPVLRIHDAALDFKDVKIDATGEARRAPPAPIGYEASGDVGVRGFEHLSDIVTSRLARAELPLLKFIDSVDKAADGTPVVKFHLASAIGRALTVNGSNLSAWFDNNHAGNPAQGQPRNLHLADPPMSGDDVRAVQKAVAAQKQELFTDGVYDTPTALAVARFQKQAGLNVDGAVDAATRDKLGIKPPPAPAAPPAPRPAAPTGPKN